MFRVNNLSDIISILNHNSNIGITKFITSNPGIVLALLLLPIAFFLSTNILKKVDDKLKNNRIYNCFKKIVLIGIFVISISFLVSNMYNPFIYFRF